MFQRWSMVRGSVADAPDAEQVAATLVEIVLEVHHLQLGQCPGEFVVVARPVQDGHDSAVEAVSLEREDEFSFDPLRGDGIGGEDEDKPVAAP